MVEFQGTWVKGQPVGKSGVAVKGYPKLQLSTSGKAPKQPKAAPVLQLSASKVKLDRFSEQTTTKGKAKDDSSVWQRCGRRSAHPGPEPAGDAPHEQGATNEVATSRTATTTAAITTKGQQ